MPHSFGYRARTRDMFARDFGKNGVNELSIYLRKYKVTHHKLSSLCRLHLCRRGFAATTATRCSVAMRVVPLALSFTRTA